MIVDKNGNPTVPKPPIVRPEPDPTFTDRYMPAIAISLIVLMVAVGIVIARLGTG